MLWQLPLFPVCICAAMPFLVANVVVSPCLTASLLGCRRWVVSQVADSEKGCLRQFVSIQRVFITDVPYNVDGYEKAG